MVHFFHINIDFNVGSWTLSHSLHHWINDGLMAIFFFLIGLEIKREITAGELSSLKVAILPILAAIGGIIGILNASKNMEAMKATNNALWEKYIAAEKDIEDTQRRSDLLKEKLKNVETLVGNTKLPIKVSIR